MKRIISALLLIMLLASCSVPDSLQMDLFFGYGYHQKLLHLNASTQVRRQRIEGFERIWLESKPLEKDFSLFAYYPDYKLTITRDGQATSLVVDINGEFVDFHYPDDTVIYRSSVTSLELKQLIHQYTDF